MRNDNFKVRSKGDAGYLANEIKNMGRGFRYEAVFWGNNIESVTIQWATNRNVFIVSKSGLGWTKRNEMTRPTLVDFIWKERKFINANLDKNHNHHGWIGGF